MHIATIGVDEVQAAIISAAVSNPVPVRGELGVKEFWRAVLNSEALLRYTTNQVIGVHLPGGTSGIRCDEIKLAIR